MAHDDEDDHPVDHVEMARADTKNNLSIYDLRTRKQKNLVLFVASFSTILLPFCDTIYLPALPAIQIDLNTTNDLVSASVSVYMFLIGLFSLVWGPMCDRFGRRLCAIIPLVGFIGATVGCILTPDITVLIIFRAFQGAFISSIIAAGQGAVADVFALKERGLAIGLFFLPVLVGPIIGPVIGGVLAQNLGWRSTFIALEIMAVPILIMLIVLLPETHHFFVLKKLMETDSVRAVLITEKPPQPVFSPPWRPLMLLLSPGSAAFAMVSLSTFAAMFVCLTLLPEILGHFYGLDPGIVGVCYLPVGLGVMISTIIGGKMSDVASQKFGTEFIEGRLIPATFIALFSPVGLLIYGWSFANHVHLAAPLIGTFFVGLGTGAYMPGLSSYLSGKNQKKAASVLAAVQCLNFCASGVFISVAVLLVEGMGIGGVFSLLAGIVVFTVVISGIVIAKRKGAAAAAK